MNHPIVSKRIEQPNPNVRDLYSPQLRANLHTTHGHTPTLAVLHGLYRVRAFRRPVGASDLTKCTLEADDVGLTLKADDAGY